MILPLAPPDHSTFSDVPGLRIGLPGGPYAWLYMDGSRLVIMADEVAIHGTTVKVHGSELADIRAATVVAHSERSLKIDCGGVGYRDDLVDTQIQRREWLGGGRGAGYQRHAPEIPLVGPPLDDPGTGGKDGGPPWDRWEQG